MDLFSNTIEIKGQEVLQINQSLRPLCMFLYLMTHNCTFSLSDWFKQQDILRQWHTFISGCWFPQRAKAIWKQRTESLALGIPFIELKQFERHIPVGVHHVYKHHITVPQALLLQGGVLPPQPGGMVLHPGWAAPQESRQTFSIWRPTWWVVDAQW